MAKMSFDTYMANSNNQQTTNNNNSVGFLSLKNDGDEAIVRIMHDSVDDFDILTYHPVSIGGKFRSVNCIREPREPMDNCPLCKNGNKIMSRIFIHMIQYTTNENGQIEAKPVVWERSISYATKLKNDIDEYGPLSNCIFKIRRNGKAGDMQTTYDMRLGNPNMYNEASYPKIEGAFNGYTACGTIVLDKNFDELSTFVATGSFPDNKGGNAQVAPAQPNMPNVEAPRGEWSQNTTNAPTNGGYVNSAPARPTRYY
jgi:hypothetical protein